MPKGYSNKTGLPHKVPKGNVFAKGNKNGCESFKGRKHTSESKEKMRKYQLEHGASNPHRFQAGHIGYNKGIVAWKGTLGAYSSLHSWVKRKFGTPKECVYCGERDLVASDGRNAIQFANVSHEYKRELSDWMPLCTPCHKDYDSVPRIAISGFT